MPINVQFNDMTISEFRALIDALAGANGDTTPPPDGGSPPPTDLAELLKGATAGGTVSIPAGRITGTGTVTVPCTVTGAGIDATIVDCTGTTPAHQKAVFVPIVPGVVFANMTIMGAAIPADAGNNAAGIRDDYDGLGFTMQHVRIKDCQNGILTHQSDYLVEDCEFANNGTGSGYEHNLYINGNKDTELTFRRSRSTQPKGGHALKSRAGTTLIEDSHLIAGGDASVLNIPDGGVVDVVNTILALPSGAANRLLLQYGVESNRNGIATVNMESVTFDNNTGQDCYIGGVAGATLILRNCTHTGIKPTISGFTTVDGDITPA